MGTLVKSYTYRKNYSNLGGLGIPLIANVTRTAHEPSQNNGYGPWQKESLDTHILTECYGFLGYWLLRCKFYMELEFDCFLPVVHM
jgi:hypothetical protein